MGYPKSPGRLELDGSESARYSGLGGSEGSKCKNVFLDIGTSVKNWGSKVIANAADWEKMQQK